MSFADPHRFTLPSNVSSWIKVLQTYQTFTQTGVFFFLVPENIRLQPLYDKNNSPYSSLIIFSCETMRHKCLAGKQQRIYIYWLVYAFGSRSKLGWMMFLSLGLVTPIIKFMFGNLTFELDIGSPKLARGPKTSRYNICLICELLYSSVGEESVCTWHPHHFVVRIGLKTLNCKPKNLWFSLLSWIILIL